MPSSALDKIFTAVHVRKSPHKLILTMAIGRAVALSGAVFKLSERTVVSVSQENHVHKNNFCLHCLCVEYLTYT